MKNAQLIEQGSICQPDKPSLWRFDTDEYANDEEGNLMGGNESEAKEVKIITKDLAKRQSRFM